MPGPCNTQRVHEVLDVALGLPEDLSGVECLDLGEDRLSLLHGVG